MSKRPTIVDVARMAGVSKSTVSLVLQDSALDRPATRDLVRRAMADIGYVYNRAAATMRLSKVGLIGLVINDLRNLVGFDDIEECAQCHPKLTSVRCDIAGFGQETARVLIDWIEHGTIPARERRAPVDLVVRASSRGELG